MYILRVNWDLRALWAVTSLPMKMYLICLFIMSVYAVLRLTNTVLPLYHETGMRDREAMQMHRDKVAFTVRHLCQLQYLFLLLFGACLANECFGMIRAIRYSVASLSAASINIFEPLTGLAFIVLLTLGFLHSIQWLVVSRFVYQRDRSESRG
jgi:hypothetical protein